MYNVAQCVVIVKGDNEQRRLVAFCVPNSKDKKLPSTDELRQNLQRNLPDYMIPAEFIWIDAIPLTTSKKIDRDTLSKMETQVLDRVNLGNPRDRLEWFLINAWQSILNKEDISITDNFFNIGGNSLLVLQLANKVEQKFGVTIPLTTFFQYKTIEEFAGFMRVKTNNAVSTSPLIPLKVSPDKMNFVCIHPAGGTVFCYLHLAELLQKMYTVYGIQSIGIDDNKEPLTSIKTMAQVYINSLGPIINEQPITIGGWSFGGYIAYEMACQLEKMGIRANVVLFDTHAPTAGQKALNTEVTKSVFIEKLLKFNGIAPGMSAQQIEKFYKIYNNNRKSVQDFLPKRFSGNVLFITTVECRELLDANIMEWNKYLDQGIIGKLIDGNHWNLMDKPQVNNIANLILEQFVENGKRSERK